MARIAIASALTLLVFVLGVQDALSTEYELQAQTLVTMLVVIGALVGLELKDVVQRRP